MRSKYCFFVAIWEGFCIIDHMKQKNEIDLKAVDLAGETFTFSSEQVSKMEDFKKLSVEHPDNKISIKITPIGEVHFEVKAQIKLKRPLNCSRCGEDFKGWFDEEATEYLSLDKNEEGEDKGFLILENHKWAWPEFIVESVELETPYQLYKYGEKCLQSCPHFDEAIEKGWISIEEPKPNAFSALEKLKTKLN